MKKNKMTSEDKICEMCGIDFNLDVPRFTVNGVFIRYHCMKRAINDILDDIPDE
jgi:hypothetical protein